MEHYRVIYEAIGPYIDRRDRVLDAGCGIGAGLMWFSEKDPSLRMVGYTISSSQYKYIKSVVGTQGKSGGGAQRYNFEAYLRSYDDLHLDEVTLGFGLDSGLG